MSCDMRFAAPDARMAITPAKLGVIYTHQPTKRLAPLVGPAWTTQLVFTEEQLGAEQALRIDLVNEVVDDEGYTSADFTEGVATFAANGRPSFT